MTAEREEEFRLLGTHKRESPADEVTGTLGL